MRHIVYACEVAVTLPRSEYLKEPHNSLDAFGRALQNLHWIVTWSKACFGALTSARVQRNTCHRMPRLFTPTLGISRRQVDVNVARFSLLLLGPETVPTEPKVLPGEATSFWRWFLQHLGQTGSYDLNEKGS